MIELPHAHPHSSKSQNPMTLRIELFRPLYATIATEIISWLCPNDFLEVHVIAIVPIAYLLTLLSAKIAYTVSTATIILGLTEGFYSGMIVLNIDWWTKGWMAVKFG